MGERKILASAVKKTSLKWVGCERLSLSGGRKRIRDEGVKGSNEEEEIAQRQKPANNHMHCLWEGEILKERKSVQIYAHMHGKQLQAASCTSPTSSLSSWTEKLEHSNKSILCSPPRKSGCRQQWESGHRSGNGRGDAPAAPRASACSLPAALAWPGQAQGAMKLKMLLCLHQGKSPNLLIFSVKEEKNHQNTQVPSFRMETKDFHMFFMCFFKTSPLS